VFDKTFVIMALACAMAPFLGAGVFLVVHLFWSDSFVTGYRILSRWIPAANRLAN